MHDIQGVPHEEIARIMGCSQGNGSVAPVLCPAAVAEGIEGFLRHELQTREEHHRMV